VRWVRLFTACVLTWLTFALVAEGDRIDAMLVGLVAIAFWLILVGGPARQR
jgi:hypothetical protein